MISNLQVHWGTAFSTVNYGSKIQWNKSCSSQTTYPPLATDLVSAIGSCASANRTTQAGRCLEAVICAAGRSTAQSSKKVAKFKSCVVATWRVWTAAEFVGYDSNQWGRCLKNLTDLSWDNAREGDDGIGWRVDVVSLIFGDVGPVKLIQPMGFLIDEWIDFLRRWYMIWCEWMKVLVTTDLEFDKVYSVLHGNGMKSFFC